MRPRASSALAASPRKKTTSTLPLGGSSIFVRSAAQGSRPAPTFFDSGCGAGERGGIGERAVAPDELATIAGPVGLSAAEIGESDARSEAHAPGIAGEDRPRDGVELRGNKRQRGRTRRAENPFDIGRHAEPARPARLIGQHEARNLDRSVDRRVLHEIGRDLVRDMLESAVSASVAGHVCRRGVSDGKRRRTPQVAAVVVSEIEGFAAAVADGVVRPRRDLIFTAVDRPGVAAALGSHLEAERRIGDDVDPRRGRRLARPEDRHILGPISREAAESVEEFQVGRGTPRRRAANAR